MMAITTFPWCNLYLQSAVLVSMLLSLAVCLQRHRLETFSAAWWLHWSF